MRPENRSSELLSTERLPATRTTGNSEPSTVSVNVALYNSSVRYVESAVWAGGRLQGPWYLENYPEVRTADADKRGKEPRGFSM